MQECWSCGHHSCRCLVEGWVRGYRSSTREAAFAHAKLVTLNYKLKQKKKMMWSGLQNNEFTYHGVNGFLTIIGQTYLMFVARVWLPRSASLDNKLPKASSWEQLMILDPNNSVAWNNFHAEPQMSHLWRSYVHACINNSLTRSNSIFFSKTEKFWPAGLEQQKISRSGLSATS